MSCFFFFWDYEWMQCVSGKNPTYMGICIWTHHCVYVCMYLAILILILIQPFLHIHKLTYTSSGDGCKTEHITIPKCSSARTHPGLHRHNSYVSFVWFEWNIWVAWVDLFLCVCMKVTHKGMVTLGACIYTLFMPFTHTYVNLLLRIHV